MYPLLYFLDDSGWFAALLPAVVFHETGHWAALRLCGARAECLRLDLAGLCMETTPLRSHRDEFFCAAAGPLGGLIWAGLASLGQSAYLRRSLLAALLLTGFNLLPALPLDGGRMLLALTGSRAALRLTGLLAALLCGALAVFYRAHGLFIPAVFALWSSLRS